jgi:hypothetical protein
MIQPKEKINLSRALFWDINEKNIAAALANSPEWVIPRVFEYGDLYEISEVIKLYREKKAKQILLKAQLRPMARAMALVFLDIKVPKPKASSAFYKKSTTCKLMVNKTPLSIHQYPHTNNSHHHSVFSFFNSPTSAARKSMIGKNESVVYNRSIQTDCWPDES